ncbi:uncharacterized protein IUM83_12378, partial [Phytophthora cinnamomi]|uniref:uncharacterized protein n=1 Tax=Phytophthora cinnamomi TaxID=4785 RepID=UPI003559602B
MVRVVACRFMRISCSEDDHPLFRRYYARSNRERGIKLLRCFPHCCPEHVQRCYCGTSIHVLVTFESDPPPAAQGEAADAPGREVQDDTNERKLRPGEVVSLPESLLPSGNRKTKPATWIRADREGEAKQNTQNATLYVLNNHRFPKWLYSYDSSVTRTQREMTHHLVVYVCQVTGTRSQHGEIDAVVLARQESPGFSLISYRRPGNNASDAGCDLPAIEGASGSTFDAVDDDMSDMISSTMNDTEIDSGSSELYETKPPHRTHQPQYQNATLYVLNNHRFPKWLYSYDSSVTRTQREMTHHLVVYVCQVTGTRSQHGEIDAVVLARQESPGFSLVSYRRSGNNASDAGCDLPATMHDMEIDSRSSELYETKPPHRTHQPQYQVFSTQPKQEEMRQRVFSGGGGGGGSSVLTGINTRLLPIRFDKYYLDRVVKTAICG